LAGGLTEQGRYDTINADFHSASDHLNQLCPPTP